MKCKASFGALDRFKMDVLSSEDLFRAHDSRQFGFCYECEHYNEQHFKPKSDLTPAEKVLLAKLLTLKSQIPAKPNLTMIPFKTSEGVWCFLCSTCFKIRKEGAR